jgi:hypothetical protein
VQKKEKVIFSRTTELFIVVYTSCCDLPKYNAVAWRAIYFVASNKCIEDITKEAISELLGDL